MPPIPKSARLESSALQFNEWNSYAAKWLSNLWPDSRVDSRSITEVASSEVESATRAHFFAGIGGWEYALQLADWPPDRQVWTGSCPCQPFSSAGKQKGTEDSRHLWPEFLRLIADVRPATVFGEQVAGQLGLGWLAGVRSDLEAIGYAVGAADLPAAGVQAPHRRQRLYWVAHSEKQFRLPRIDFCRQNNVSKVFWSQRSRGPAGCETSVYGSEPRWAVSKSELESMADGVHGRVGKLRAYGNAIVPQVAAVFIRSFLEATGE